jgi:hypothetical protein
MVNTPDEQQELLQAKRNQSPYNLIYDFIIIIPHNSVRRNGDDFRVRPERIRKPIIKKRKI